MIDFFLCPILLSPPSFHRCWFLTNTLYPDLYLNVYLCFWRTQPTTVSIRNDQRKQTIRWYLEAESLTACLAMKIPSLMVGFIPTVPGTADNPFVKIFSCDELGKCTEERECASRLIMYQLFEMYGENSSYKITGLDSCC